MASAGRPAADREPRRAVDPASRRAAATRERLLAAAEQCFLEQPYDEVSVRTINAAAGCNPAAAHYHFGSKEGLVVALLEDRLAGETTATRARFAELERAEHVDLDEIVGLAVDPMLALARGTPIERLHVHLLAMVLLRGSEVPFVSDAFSLDRWAGVVSRAVPHVPPAVVRTRWAFVVTLILELAGRPLGRGNDQAVTVDRDALAAFLAAGVAAPA